MKNFAMKLKRFLKSEDGPTRYVQLVFRPSVLLK